MEHVSGSGTSSDPISPPLEVGPLAASEADRLTLAARAAASQEADRIIAAVDAGATLKEIRSMLEGMQEEFRSGLESAQLTTESHAARTEYLISCLTSPDPAQPPGTETDPGHLDEPAQEGSRLRRLL